MAPAVVALSLSVERVEITRHGSTTLTAVARYADGSTRIVSGEANWGSSDPSVATADGGVVRGVGLGAARVFAVYESKTATADVSVRRNMLLQGEVTVAHSLGHPVIYSVRATVDGRPIAYADCRCDYSGFKPSFTLVLGGADQDRANAVVAPGAAEVSLVVYAGAHAPMSLMTGPQSFVEIVDADTQERLATIPLGVQQMTLSDGGQFSWPIAVPAGR